MINQYGVYQKCFSRKSRFYEDGKFGSCKDYRSKLHPLTDSVRNALFPHLGSRKKIILCELNTPKLCREKPDKAIRNDENFLKYLEDFIMGKPAHEKRFYSKRSRKKRNK